MENNELRREKVHANKTSAIIALNLTNIYEGEVLSFRYYRDDGTVDSIVAVGLRDGLGPDCYTLISDQSIPVISGILDSYPDVSEVYQGRVFLVKDPGDGRYRRSFINVKSREDKELSSSFYFVNLSDNKYYYFDLTHQKIIDVSANLTEKASFGGIINCTEEEYQDLMVSGGIQESMLYLVNNGKHVLGLFYNGMSFEIDYDPSGDIGRRVTALEEAVLENTLVWED